MVLKDNTQEIMKKIDEFKKKFNKNISWKGVYYESVFDFLFS